MENVLAWGVNLVVVAAAWGAMRQKLTHLHEQMIEVTRCVRNGLTDRVTAMERRVDAIDERCRERLHGGGHERN